MNNLIIILGMALIGNLNCSNLNIKDHIYQLSKKEIPYPITMEWGAYGKGSSLPSTILSISADSVRVTRRINFNKTKTFSIPTQETEFNRVLLRLNEYDLIGEKHYSNPLIRDGGYIQISSKLGERRFVNVFTSSYNSSEIRPDTIGLKKYEEIKDYALEFLNQLG